MQIKIGDLVIQDNGDHDLNPDANVIQFDSRGVNPPGFDLPENSTVRWVKGKVDLGHSHTVIELLDPVLAALRLTEFEAEGSDLDPNVTWEVLEIEFQHEFAVPAGSSIEAAYQMDGELHAAQGQSVEGGSLLWWGYVDDYSIGDVYRVIPGGDSGENVQFEHSDQEEIDRGMMAPNGNQVTLKGKLEIALVRRGHQLTLPHSAEIAVGLAKQPRQQQVQAKK